MATTKNFIVDTLEPSEANALVLETCAVELLWVEEAKSLVVTAFPHYTGNPVGNIMRAPIELVQREYLFTFDVNNPLVDELVSATSREEEQFLRTMFPAVVPHSAWLLGCKVATARYDFTQVIRDKFGEGVLSNPTMRRVAQAVRLVVREAIEILDRTRPAPSFEYRHPASLLEG